MSKKPDTASALAGILSAKRGEQRPADPVPVVTFPAQAESRPTPSPALPPPAPSAGEKAVVSPGKPRGGKSSDKANYSQFSVYLRKDTRKKVGRALDDAETGQDFSELVQELLEHWLTSRT